jgi:DNA-binding phage protein
MSERIPAHEVTWHRRYLGQGLDCEEAFTGYMMEAAEEGPAGVLDAFLNVARARLINEVASTTGLDRLRLCAALDGGPPLDDAEIQKLLDYFNVRVPMETSVAVG